MRVRFLPVFLLQLVFCLIISLVPEFCFGIEPEDDFGCRWVSTLNHSIHSVGETEKLLLFRSGERKAREKEFFDVDKIHLQMSKELQRGTKKDPSIAKSVGGDHNIVVASISMVVQHDSGPAVFNYPLKEVFVSGSADVNRPRSWGKVCVGASSYSVCEIFEALHARLEQHSNTRINELIHLWGAAQKEVLDEARRIAEEAMSTNSPPSNYRYGEIMSKHADKSNTVLFSATDSEQYLIRFLKDNFYKTQEEFPDVVEGIYGNMRNEYHRVRREMLRDSVTFSFNSEADAKTGSEGKYGDFFSHLVRQIGDFKKYSVLGTILHIHSTNEICCCCTASLSAELKVGGLFKRLEQLVSKNQDIKTEPFFTVLASCDQRLTVSSDTRIASGVPVEHGVPQLHFDQMRNEGWFPQWLVTEKEVAESTD